VIGTSNQRRKVSWFVLPDVMTQYASGVGDVTPSVLESRWFIAKTPRDALDRRDARRRTRTAKLLNSNSFMGTNNRLGLPLKLIKNFIVNFLYHVSPSTYVAGDAISTALAPDFAFLLSD